MSAVVLLSPEELTRLIREAVRAELSNDAPRSRSDSWLSIKATGLPSTTIRKLIKAGTIRAAKVGRELRVNAADVQNYLVSASAKKPKPAQVIQAGDAFDAAMARARAERRSA